MAAPTFEFIPLAALPDHAAVEWLFEPLVMRESVTMLAGAPAQGKTFLGMHVALSMATGGHRVIWVAGEGAYDIKARAEAWLTNHQRSRPETFIVLPREVNFMLGTEIDAFIEALRAQKPTLVVLDSLMNMLVGGDENYAKDATIFMQACWRIVTDIGASVLIIHHAGWESSRERGSSVLRASPVQSFICKMQPGSGTLPPTISLTCLKNRRGPVIGNLDWITKPVDVNGHTVLAVMGVSGAPVKTEPVNTEHVEWLRSVFLRDFVHAGATSAQLRESSKLPERMYQRALNELISAGEIQADGPRTKSTIYRLGPRYEVRRGVAVKKGAEPYGEHEIKLPTSDTPKGGVVIVGKMTGKKADMSGKFQPDDLAIDLDLAAEELKKGPKA